MKYTKERLAVMSDYDIECAIEKIIQCNKYPKATNFVLDDNDRILWFEFDGKQRGKVVSKFCSDWSVTGPLMIEYGFSLMQTANDDKWCAWNSEGGIDDFSCNKNPLRAICEVILMTVGDK